jgi:hypothetical protein
MIWIGTFVFFHSWGHAVIPAKKEREDANNSNQQQSDGTRHAFRTSFTRRVRPIRTPIKLSGDSTIFWKDEFFQDEKVVVL